MMRRIAVLAVAGLASLSIVGALAQDKEAVVKERAALMKSQAHSLGAIKAYLNGDADQARAAEAAMHLVASAKKIPEVFPPGTSIKDVPPPGKYGAKPIIWTEWDKFLAAQKTMVSEAEKLEAAVKTGDKSKVQTQFAETGKMGCGGCHGTFREKVS